MDRIACPSCGRLLKGRNDLAGISVQCPACGAVFCPPPEEAVAAPVPAAEPPAPPEPAPLPPGPAPARDLSDWLGSLPERPPAPRRVGSAIAFVIIAGLVVFAAVRA